MKFYLLPLAFIFIAVTASAQQTIKKPLKLTLTEEDLRKYSESARTPSQNETVGGDCDQCEKLKLEFKSTKEMNLGVGIKNLQKGKFVIDDARNCALNWKIDPGGTTRAGITCGSSKKSK